MESNIFIDPKYAELIIEINRLKLKLAEKIAEKEMLSYYVIPEIKNTYMLKIGITESELFLAKLNLEKLNRKIELYEKLVREKQNFQESYIDEIIDKEFKEDYKKYEVFQKDIENALDYTKKEKIGKKDFENINIIFDELIIKLCPIINKNSDLENNLYDLTIKSYREANFKKLLGIQMFLIQNNYKAKFEIDDYENLVSLKENFLKSLDEVKKSIFEIRSSEMFSNKSIIENENLIRRKKIELNNQISDVSNEYEILLKRFSKIKKFSS